ncbi:MAG: sodium ion-translocating decarboxylase subunit beta, partial [Bacteroidaceae bacterium]|nr:sodium ion-translocating decarboxylase subunit beta [Bacteroidaceae bacterium]
MKKIKFLSLLALMLLVATPMLAAGIDAGEGVSKFLEEMGFVAFFLGEGWKNAVMLVIGCFLLYLAIKKEYEPLLLLPIAFGMILTNLPGVGMFDSEMWNNEFLNPDSPNYHSYGYIMAHGGLLDILYIGVKAGVYPCLIVLGVGAMTDFGPLIANPKSLLLGAAAQIGIFATFLVTQIDWPIFGFTPEQAASIGIIGGADGPTAIFLTSKLAPELLGPIAVAAYSYMSLVPIIQPPIMKALTTEAERKIQMEQLRFVSKKERIIFPIVVTIVVCLILPSTAPLVGMLMLGNLFRESGVVRQLTETASNALMYIVVIFLGTSVGATTSAEA